MDSTSRMLRTVLRGLALLVTLGIGAYLVVSAQVRSSRVEAGSEPAAENVAPPPPSDRGAEEPYLSSSKFLVLEPEPALSAIDLQGFGQAADEDAMYLWGSKFGAVPTVKELSGAADEAAPAADAKRP